MMDDKLILLFGKL